jgi:hypothetical protein
MLGVSVPPPAEIVKTDKVIRKNKKWLRIITRPDDDEDQA